MSKRLNIKGYRVIVKLLISVTLLLSFGLFTCHEDKIALEEKCDRIEAQRDSITFAWTDALKTIELQREHYKVCAWVDTSSIYVDNYGQTQFKNPLSR